MIPAMACVEFIFTLFPAPPFCRVSALLQLVEFYTILSILTLPIFMKICSQGIFMRLCGSYLFTQAKFHGLYSSPTSRQQLFTVSTIKMVRRINTSDQSSLLKVIPYIATNVRPSIFASYRSYIQVM